jgi:hypothetical protein
MQNPNQARHNSKKTSRIFGGYDKEFSCKMPVLPDKPSLTGSRYKTRIPCIREENGLS